MFITFVRTLNMDAY